MDFHVLYFYLKTRGKDSNPTLDESINAKNIKSSKIMKSSIMKTSYITTQRENRNIRVSLHVNLLKQSS